MSAVRLVEDPVELAGALSPVRRRVLAALTEPSSATRLAPLLGLSRQKINYHLRILEQLGLIELVEVRQRRGCTERVLRRTGPLVVDPAVLEPVGSGASGRVATGDRNAAEHLIAAAGRTVREVTRMQAAAAQQGRRLLTFTVETEVAFADPVDVHRFTDELAAALAAVADRFHTDGGRRYAVTIGGHPAAAPAPTGAA
ncbi:ArsR/SmtB family transcription factor [Microlunatus ginsengisoli]|uniref:Helix-turn-helix domain-containing protein n=1 Tax=Microlunatus ginsengisoli TaxID=363863 RepID=A0ABP6ZKQ7_9ACTN